MKIEHVVWIVVGVLVVVALGSWWLVNTPLPVEPTEIETETEMPAKPIGTTTSKPVTSPAVPAPAQPAPQKAYASGLVSINDLLKLSALTKYSCTFSVANPYRTGKFYLAERKWRGDFSNGVSMINDGGYIYVWSKGETEGLQVVSTSGVVGNTIVREGAIDAFTPLNYDCDLWTPDMSVFVPPSGIVFKNTEGYPYQ
jgi:hypothetical protein